MKNTLTSYICPSCRRPLRSVEDALHCGACNQTYPIVDGITNFIPEDVLLKVAPNYRDIKRLEFLAPAYESWLWQSFILHMAGGWGSSLSRISRYIAETLEGVTGSVLDVACGPATYGRRMASPYRSVFGIDFSMGTLRQGMKNIAHDGVTNIQLARTRVEELPFENAFFDGAICGGSLHLFPDALLALCEIARTLKAGAPLVVTTFVEGGSLLPRMMKRRGNMHAFELPVLRQYLAEAGLDGFDSELDGAFIMFRTRKVTLAK